MTAPCRELQVHFALSDSVKVQKSHDMQGLIGRAMLTHKERAIQWIAEHRNSLSSKHASVAAKGNLDAQIVISFWEGSRRQAMPGQGMLSCTGEASGHHSAPGV